MDVGRRDPCFVDFVLKSGLGVLKVNRQVQRENESEERDHERENADVTVAKSSNSAPARGTNVTSVKIVL
jgi:hypothetical protein